MPYCPLCSNNHDPYCICQVRTVTTPKTAEADSSRAPLTCSANSWWVTVCDGFTTHTYEIDGTDYACIQDVADAVATRLDGRIIRQWLGERADSQNYRSERSQEAE